MSLDVASKFQDALRSAARGGATTHYICPICRESSNAGFKIWEHAKQAHPDSPEITGHTEGDEAKALFLAKARQNKASQPPDRLSGSKPSPLKPISPERPLSAPSYAQAQGEWIDDTEKLTIGQERRDRSQIRQQERQLASDGKGIILEAPTRKRGAEDDVESSDSPSGSPAVHLMTTRGQHAKTASGGFSVAREQEVSNPGRQTGDAEYRRDVQGATTSLWDPNIDNPNTGKLHRERHQSLANNSPRRLNPTKDSGSKPRKPGLLLRSRKPQALKAHQEQSMSNEPGHTVLDETQKPLRPGLEQTLSGGDSPPLDGPPEDPDVEPEMLLQPDTRPISHEQLVVEVKGIYAGLVMVEAKCIDIDDKQSSAAQEKDPTKRMNLKNDQWQSLIALHKQLLHEHHDFFLASQHPSASPALSRLAAKYSMPARMWRHGIHAFLEVLRHRLPESLEHMLAFIYIAYSMMALLYETVSTFEDTWIECLGDLGRYRMAIEDDEPKDREVWSNVARFWYNKAADKSPNVGRLYHHLAILARPYTIEQLSLYLRSLTCITPFESAKGSIMTLFNPILNGKESVTRRSSSFETIFIKAHGSLFIKGPTDPSDQFDEAMKQLEGDEFSANYIEKTGTRFKEIGVFAAVANIAAMFEYGIAKQGVPKPILRLAFDAFGNAKQGGSPQPGFSKCSDTQTNVQAAPFGLEDFETLMSSSPDPSIEVVALASRIAFSTLSISLRRPEDPNVHPLVHVYFVFLRTLVIVEQAMRCIEEYVPWEEICSFLNFLSTSRNENPSLRSRDFPEPEEGPGRPLPEDYVMRGQLYSQWYFPEAWFADPMIDDDERSLEVASMAEPRADRLFWLGHRIASIKKWIYFDEAACSFSPTEYIRGLCGLLITVSQPDQIGDESRMEADPNDEDSIMDDAMFNADTPQTSLAAFDSQCPSKESTRASTPTDSRAEDGSINNLDFKPLEPDDIADDVTMKDLDPKVGSSTKAPDEFSTSQLVSWPSNAVTKPGSSPGKAGQSKLEVVDYDAGPQNFEELVQTDDLYSPNLIRP